MRARNSLVGLVAALVVSGAGGCGDDSQPTTSTSEPTTTQPALLCPEAGGDDALDTATLVGETVDQASVTAKDHGCEVRVVEEDGEEFAVTLDFNPDRINVAVEDGAITKIVSLG